MLIIHAGTAVSTPVRDTGSNDYNLIEVAPDRVSIRIMTWRKETASRLEGLAPIDLRSDVGKAKTPRPRNRADWFLWPDMFKHASGVRLEGRAQIQAGYGRFEKAN